MSEDRLVARYPCTCAEGEREVVGEWGYFRDLDCLETQPKSEGVSSV